MVYCLDPLRDARWSGFVRRHPDASVFHTSAWLRALQQTYGYEPLVLTTSAPSEDLKNGLLFCAVRSWVTGSRLVSLPFSDHCEPLLESPQQWDELGGYLGQVRKRRGWKYIEIRSFNPVLAPRGEFQRVSSFCLHRLDLRPSLEILLSKFHKDCVQRKIRRAEREQLTYEAGRSEELLRKLYGLLRITRRRLHLPPQPLHWFRTLVRCAGEEACIRIASKEGRPVAGMLALRHGKRMVYKYGGADARFNNLGGMVLLFWKTIQEAKQSGIEELDFGRSEYEHQGLIAFKDHWATRRSELTYWRAPASSGGTLLEGASIRFARTVCQWMPEPVVAMAGKVLYRHIG